MFLSTWLRNRRSSLQRWLAQQQKQSRKSFAHPLARTLLCLEVLEDRITPSGFQSLYSFTGGADGSNPQGSVIADRNGNIDGTTFTANTFGGGSVFQFNPSSNALTLLHTFSFNSAYWAASGLLQDSSGNFYGTTRASSGGGGTVYKLSSDGSSFTILHNFAYSANDGYNPYAGLIMDGKGNLYGTSANGGTNGNGTVFELSPDGSGGYNFSILHSFSPTTDGWNPQSGLVMDGNGNLYGVAETGGANGDGTVFELSPNGSGGYTFSVLYNFTGGSDGKNPLSTLLMDGNGNLYGTASAGGTSLSGSGVLFELNPSTKTMLAVHSFQYSEGYNPSGNLILDSQGNLYGTTQQGGANGGGTVYEASPDGAGGFNISPLHGFNIIDGEGPFGGLVADSSGNLYGTTLFGGANNDGTLFEITGAINVTPATTTTASNVTAAFSPNAQNVTLTANITSGSGKVNEGTVTFTLMQGATVIGSATTSNTVSNGQASVSYALPAGLTHGVYTIDAVYSGGADFAGSADTSHALTLAPAIVTTTADSFLSTYTNTSTQSLLLSATVSDTSIPSDTVTEGYVTFTVTDKNGNTVGSSVQGNVSGGTASAYFTLPKAQPAGTYTINVTYKDNTGNFVDGGDAAGTLTNNPSPADTTALNLSTAYSTKTQSLTLNANVSDDLDSSETISEGTVNFTALNSGVAIAVGQGNVIGGAASAKINLPAGLAPGNYAITVSYSDGAGNFADFRDTPGTLTVTPANVVTTASNVATVYRVNAQTVKLSAKVADTSNPSDTVGEGVVTFSISSGGTSLGSVQGNIIGGTASANFNLPAGLAAGNYSIGVSYKDSAGKFTDNGDVGGTLSIGPAKVTATASNVAAIFSPNKQALTLTAAVLDASISSESVGEGTVTFTVRNGNTIVGTAQGAVIGSTATANFNLPAGQAAGSYTIGVSYFDMSGNFVDGGDTGGTLTLAPANVTTTAVAANLTFNPAAQTVKLNATLADTSIPSDQVGEGIVTFTVHNSQIVVGTITANVSGGKASANFAWTPGRAAGSYTIDISYQDSQGNFLDTGDTSATLTVTPALVTTTAANASAIFSPNVQTVALTASVACPNVPVSALDTNTVTFTLQQGSTVVGTAQGVVANGTADANFSLPAGLAAGKYTIAVSYSDSHGNFADGGDTNATLTVTPAGVTTTANNAVVIVPNPKGATLTAFVTDSANSGDTVAEGTVTFTVLNGTTVVGSSVQGTVSGGTASAPFIPPSGIAAGTYTVSASYSDSLGNFTDNGDTSATLTVLLVPAVTASPVSQTVPVGGTAIFTAAANGSPTLNVQWQVSTDGGKTFTNIGGATSTTLTLGNVQASQNGYQYQAVFTNSYGSATTSVATLTVPFAPMVTTNPSNQTIIAGQSVTFTAAANGSPSPTVQWQVSSDGGKTWTNISGATSTSLALSNVQAAQNGSSYQAVFSNNQGTATSNAATLTVQFAPTVAIQPSTQTVTAGQKVTFLTAASANPTATVQWQLSTDGGKTFTNIDGALSPVLTLAGVTTAMSGNEYQAVFTNSIGSTTTSAATLTVNPAVLPVITGNPVSQTTSSGATVSFTASASGDPAPTAQWQVSTDGGATFSNISGATSPTLTLSGVTPAMNGFKYQAVFSNSAGSVVSIPVTLSVPSAPPSSSGPITLNVPPLLALIGQLIRGIETDNANNTETVVYSMFGIALVTAEYDGAGNFLNANLLGFAIPNWVWLV